jgi:hypothetical protein
MAYLFRKTLLALVLAMVETVGPFLPVYLCNLYVPGISSRDGHETGRYMANGMMENYNRRRIDKSFVGLAEAA